MKLATPFIIGSRLLPALKVDDGTISLDFVGCANNRMVFRWYIDIPAGEFTEADLKSGIQGCTTQEMFGTLLAFLGACGEGYSYQQRTGRESENADLFPPEVAEWSYVHQDELDMLREEIESTADLIDE